MPLFEKAYTLLIEGGAGITILKGLCATLRISFFSVILGTLLGIIVCALRMSRFKVLRIFAKIYIVILRGSPLTMLLMLFYYCIFVRTNLSAETVAIITFGVNTAAYVSEMLRSAMENIDEREIEAARTLGFSAFQAFYLISLPQVVKNAAPVYQSIIINLIQWTSVAGYVTITDLTRVINNISSRTMEPLFMIVTGMIIYIAISYLVAGFFALVQILERLKKSQETR